jgi:16S rRNA processing protein RimM
VEWIELGRLGAPFGVQGWIHVESHTEPPLGIFEYPGWMLRLPRGERFSRKVLKSRAHGAGQVALLEGVSDRDEAAALTGAVIEVERAALPATRGNEYYRADLLGLAVRNLEGADFGRVSHFVDAPTGALMVTRTPVGQEHWVLAVPKHVRKVDLAAGEIVVDWPAELE